MKQRKALIEAYQDGYYDIPRKINTTELASKLEVAPSTFQEHLRKAEKKLMSHVLDGLLKAIPQPKTLE